MLVYFVVSIFLTFMNPYYATRELIYPLAFAYWFVLILSGAVAGELCSIAYQRIWPSGPRWPMLAFSAAGAALAVTGFIVLLESQFFMRPIPLNDVPRVYGLVLVISIALTMLSELVDRAFVKDPAATGEATTNPQTKFLERLPVRYRTADLWAIASEDHYCRVYTSLGREMVLLRLSDAERELAGANGLRVHRSWWVAKDGIADAKREDGRIKLVLKSGEEVPVSRSYQAAVREAGLAP